MLGGSVSAVATNDCPGCVEHVVQHVSRLLRRNSLCESIADESNAQGGKGFPVEDQLKGHGTYLLSGVFSPKNKNCGSAMPPNIVISIQ